MGFIKTSIDGVWVFEPTVYKDPRGYFYESYNENTFKAAGINYKFVQDNQSKSSYGVLRGLHFQKEPYAQTKLVRALQGNILDVAVDLRPNSPTFKQHVAIVLSGENFKQLLIPKGFAHGFVVLSETAIITYKCDEFYNPQSDAGVIYNDSDLNINWTIPEKDILLSTKDAKLPTLKQILG